MVTTVQNKVQHAARQVYEGVGTVVDAAGRSVTKVDGLDKLTKLVLAILEPFAIIFPALAPLKLLKGRLKNAKDLFGGLNIIDRANEWFNGGMLKKSRQKIIGRAFLTAGHTLECYMFFDSMGFGIKALSNIARFPGAFSVLSPLGVAKDTFMVGSAICGIWDSANTVKRSGKEISAGQKKIVKWEAKQALVRELEQGNAVKIQEVKDKYEAKLKDKQAIVNDPQTKPKYRDATVIKVQRIQKYLTELNAGSFNTLATRAADKISLNNINVTVSKKKETVAGIGIGFDSMKLVMITAGTTALVTGIVALPVLFGLAAAGIVTTTFGYAKFLLESFNEDRSKDYEKQKEALALKV
jgi:hypothetical protein